MPAGPGVASSSSITGIPSRTGNDVRQYVHTSACGRVVRLDRLVPLARAGEDLQQDGVEVHGHSHSKVSVRRG